MAIPNIVNVATIHAETLVTVLTTTLTTTLATAEAEHVYKINVLRCTNITDSDATVTIDIEKGGAFGSYLIRSLKPNIIVKEMKDDKSLKHLDKLRSFLKEFNDENVILKYRFARIAHKKKKKLNTLT